MDSEGDLNKQTLELPNTANAGASGIRRNAQFPGLLDVFSPEINTIYDLFYNGYKISKDKQCMGIRPIINPVTRERANYYEWETYEQVNQRITWFGSGLLDFFKNDLGYTRLEQIPLGIWTVNRPEWHISELAAAAYSMYIVALYDTLGPETVEYVINHAELETVICSKDHVVDLLKLREKIPQLKAIICLDDFLNAEEEKAIKGWAEEKGVIVAQYADIEERGKQKPLPHNYAKRDDLSCLMYTSGTTGMPKGAMISHGNLIAAVSASRQGTETQDTDVELCYLPLAHIYGRLVDLVVFTAGGSLGFFSGAVETLMEDMLILKPTMFPAVPRLLNRIYAKIVQVTQEPGAKGALLRWAIATKLKNLEEGRGFQHPVLDRLVFNKIKQVIGGRVRYIVSGSAPIGSEVLQFLRVVFSCDIREGYGATETAAACSNTMYNDGRAGHVGRPVSSNEIKLVDVPEMDYLSTDKPNPRGEVCVRGYNVIKGYYKDEEKTREAFDEDGWYHTGDIGMFDERGSLILIDRKKNIFKLAQGEYIAPEKIENVYTRDPIVAQFYLHGDSLHHQLVGIVVADEEVLRALVSSKLPALAGASYSELINNKQVTKLVLERLTLVGKQGGLRGFEFAKAIRLVNEPFTIENGLLTPTLKVKRPQARKHFEKQIAELYEELGSATQNAARL
ncbi:hypothetical protein BJV82DRAFT_578117 [Fennellomyces sp. T-0311]|nr:hypothetical protein BJV82DRAFT_578117 [Fennellomyces sp. T-0311]